MGKRRERLPWGRMDWLVLIATAVIYVGAAVFIFFYQMDKQDSFRAMTGIISPLFLFIPYVAQLVFRRKFGYWFFLFCQCFCFMAFSLGVALNLYKTLPLYDKFIHMLSGILFYIAGLMLYEKIAKVESYDLREKWLLQLTYAFGVSMSIAVLWEVYEFLGYVLTGMDMQYHEETGVFDTMLDLCACLIGTLLSAVFHGLYGAKGLNSPFIKIFHQALIPKGVLSDK